DDKGALFEESDWRGREFEAHRLLNDEVEDSLRILLDPVQFDRLPPRRWQWSDEAKEKEQKAGAKRSGRGKGSGAKGSGGKGSGGKGSGGKD
ncbi:MAG: hypothetical protein VX727_07005, partial [Planctomycetota bacterium]|nr:hypothetical protein [Planctomycetota bacterium]